MGSLFQKYCNLVQFGAIWCKKHPREIRNPSAMRAEIRNKHQCGKGNEGNWPEERFAGGCWWWAGAWCSFFS